MAVDDSYTKLLLHCNGADNGTTFTDEAGNTVTAVGNACLKTAQKKFGTASAYFDGSGDYLTVPHTADWDMGSGDFTVDCWVYHPDDFASYEHIVSYRAQAPVYGSWDLALASGKPAIYCSAGSGWAVTLTANTVIPKDAWVHLALARYGLCWVIWQDGVPAAAAITGAVTLATLNTAVSIGALGNGDEPYKGYIDEVRISKGIARVQGFTVPAAEYAPPAVNGGIFSVQFI